MKTDAQRALADCEKRMADAETILSNLKEYGTPYLHLDHENTRYNTNVLSMIKWETMRVVKRHLPLLVGLVREEMAATTAAARAAALAEIEENRKELA